MRTRVAIMSLAPKFLAPLRRSVAKRAADPAPSARVAVLYSRDARLARLPGRGGGAPRGNAAGAGGGEGGGLAPDPARRGRRGAAGDAALRRRHRAAARATQRARRLG